MRGQQDMNQCDIDLLTPLFSVNVSLNQISQILEQIKGPQTGTFTPKRLYNMNQRTEDFQNFALGLLPDCNDARKKHCYIETSSFCFFHYLSIHFIFEFISFLIPLIFLFI